MKVNEIICQEIYELAQTFDLSSRQVARYVYREHGIKISRQTGWRICNQIALKRSLM